MKATPRAWLPMTVVAVMLLTALVILYNKAQRSGDTSYVGNVSLLRQIKQLDAEWELEVLKSRMGIRSSYDPLAASLAELNWTLEKLGTHLLAQKHDKSEALLEGQGLLLSAIQEKAGLTERFKSNNSVLRNSLAFLPTAAQDVRVAGTRGGRQASPAAARVLATVNDLLLATMVNSQGASGERLDEIRAGLAELEALSPNLAPDFRERVGVFVAHVRTVLREQKNVNDLLGAIAEVRAVARIDDIGNVLIGEQRQNEVQDRSARAYLMVLSAVLLVLLAGAAIYLLRSHAVIARVNRQLKGANENLEHRVNERNRELHQITDAVPALIAYVDAGRRFRFHNKACEQVLGLAPDQIQGRTLREVFSDEIHEAMGPRVDEVLAGMPVQFDNLTIDSSNGPRDFAVQFLPRHRDDREDHPVIGFYALFTDITEMKRIDRMKTEFVSTVSHELRTPLTSIRGSLGLVAGGVAGVLPDAAKTLIDIAKNNCERLIRLINNILDTEKIESGKMRFELKVLELQSVVAQTIAANDGFAAQHGVSFALLTSGEAVRVNADSDGLSQVLTNLLSNAVKFSPKGACVDVSVTRGRQRVRVEVRDRGPGIPEEFRGRIFQKFSQADSSDSRQKGGTGLGLNISKAIIDRLGGTIGFCDHAEGGTVFFFELPVAQDRPAAFSTAAAQGPERLRVLVCEDDPDIARLIGMMLDGAGYDTDFAYNAGQASELAIARPYAAMTVDLKLPDLDGIALIRALREDSGTRDLPIIVISANLEEGRRQFDSEQLTVSAWLDKPIDANRLVAAMRDAIAGGVMPELAIL
jgi:PAS domain S-box-containing protein